jgi:hypothetical protein
MAPCTADILAKEQEGRVDEAMRIALRIIEERAELVHRMAEDGKLSGRLAVARMYAAGAKEYRDYADMIRRVILDSLGPPRQSDVWEPAVPIVIEDLNRQLSSQRELLLKAEAEIERAASPRCPGASLVKAASE